MPKVSIKDLLDIMEDAENEYLASKESGCKDMAEDSEDCGDGKGQDDEGLDEMPMMIIESPAVVERLDRVCELLEKVLEKLSNADKVPATRRKKV